MDATDTFLIASAAIGFPARNNLNATVLEKKRKIEAWRRRAAPTGENVLGEVIDHIHYRCKEVGWELLVRHTTRESRQSQS